MIALVAVALAAGPDLAADLHGDVKSFYIASFPYTSPLFPSDPAGIGVLDGRLKFEATVGDTWSLQAHHAVTFLPGSGAGMGGLRTGVAPSAPEAVPLTWVAVDGDGLRVQGRTDRLVLRANVCSLGVAVGRQPISFGSGAFFTPMDLVNPFTPAVIDQEYKPGVDAVRVDGYVGMSGVVTAVAAYAGSWDADGLVVATYGQGTVGVTDIGGFAGLVRGDAVVGATVVSAIGPVGINADVTVTKPDGDPFVRAVAGAMWRPTNTTTLSGEVYLQTLGKADPAEYLAFAMDDRFASGELWLFGRTYAGVAVAQDITPTVSANLAVIGNLEDASALVTPAVSWSIDDNATFALGGFVGVGERPEALSLASEFGTYPVTGFAQVKAYF